MKQYRVKGNILVVSANDLRDAVRKLICSDFELRYFKAHLYPITKYKEWADVETGYGYKCIIEEV